MPTVGTQAIETSPRCALPGLAGSRPARPRDRRAGGAPAAGSRARCCVSATERVVRSTSFTPSSASRFCSRRVSAVCVMWSVSRRLLEAALLRDRDEGLDAEGVEFHELNRINHRHKFILLGRSRLVGRSSASMDTRSNRPPTWPPASTRRMARNLERRAPAPRPAAHPRRQGAARAPRRPRGAGARAGPERPARCAPTASCSRTCSGRPAMLQFMQTRRERVAVPDHDPLRPPDPGAASRARRICARRSPRTARSTTSCARPRRSTAPASGSPAPASSIRSCSRTTPSPARSSSAPTRTRRTPAGSAPARSASAAPTRSRSIAGLPWELLLPAAHRGVPDRRARRLDRAEGRDPLGGRPAHRLGRHQRDRRVHRARRAHAQRHRQGDDRQHGRRAGRDDVDVPRRRAHGRVPAGDGPRRARARSSSGTARCSRPTPRSRRDPEQHYDRVLELDLSHARAARRRAALARPRAPALARSPPRCATRATASSTRSRPR